MALLTITATSVLEGAGAEKVSGLLGETITAGQVVYKAAGTSKWMKADADSATAEVRKAQGIALNGGAINQPVVVLTKGLITIGATVTPGTSYYLAATAGGIGLFSDLPNPSYVVLLGIATTATEIDIDIKYPDVEI